MKKKFIVGLLVGILGTLAVTVGVNTLMLNGWLRNNSIENKVDESESDNVQVEEEVDYRQIVNKLNFLEGLVENYYLNEVDASEYESGIYKGFMSSLGDPYTTYYTNKEYTALMESSSGTYFGIGASVSQNAKTGIITIVKPFETGPAYEAGVLPGDIIYQVEGEDVAGLDLTEVVSRLKGETGTKVKLSVYRGGVSEAVEFTISRRKIEAPTIEYKMLADNIGYVMITEFDEITVSQFADAVNQLEKNGMVGLVVDVRNNPGGLLNAVVRILDRLLPPGLLVYTEDKNKVREEESAVDEVKINVPVSVLINGNSASASEIFAGAIQDYGIGTVVGTTSFGKGIVQKVVPLNDGSAIKLTISKYFTPNGRDIHGKGISPDVEVELNDEVKQMVTIPVEDDNQLQEAIKVLKTK